MPTTTEAPVEACFRVNLDGKFAYTDYARDEAAMIAAARKRLDAVRRLYVIVTVSRDGE